MALLRDLFLIAAQYQLAISHTLRESPILGLTPYLITIFICFIVYLHRQTQHQLHHNLSGHRSNQTHGLPHKAGTGQEHQEDLQIWHQTLRSFCSRRALIPLPADQSTLCLFAAYLSRRVSYQFTLTYLATVTHWHRTMGFCNPAATCSNPHLQLILRGIQG